MKVTAAEIETDLAGISFPAYKEGLVRYAEARDAGERVVLALQELPDREYTSLADVVAAAEAP